MRKRIYLHDIIEAVLLREDYHKLTVRKITDIIEKEILWLRTTDSQIPSVKQIAARINKYPSRFERRERRIGLSSGRKLQNSLRYRT